MLADLVAGLTARAPAAAGERRSTGPPGRQRQAAAAGPPPPEPGLIGGGRGGVVLLRKTWRFGGDIAELAAAVRDGDADGALAVLGKGRQSVALVGPGDPGARHATWSPAPPPSGPRPWPATAETALARLENAPAAVRAPHRAPGSAGVDQADRELAGRRA